MATKKIVNQKTTGKKPATADQQKLASELYDVADSLGIALGDIIDAMYSDTNPSVMRALRRVHSARIVLQGEAEKLTQVST